MKKLFKRIKLFVIGLITYYRIPKSWKKVPYNRLSNIIDIDYRSDSDTLQDILTYLTNDDEVADKIPLYFLPLVLKRLQFLHQTPSIPKSKYIRIGWHIYKRHDFDSMTISQFTDVMVQISTIDSIEKMLNVSASMFKPWYKTTLENNNLTKKIKLFSSASVYDIRANFEYIHTNIKKIIQRYNVLFSMPENEEIDIEEKINSNKKTSKVTLVEQRQQRERELWAWYGILDKLAGSNILKYQEVEKIPLHQALIFLSYHARQANDEVQVQRTLATRKALQMKNNLNKR